MGSRAERWRRLTRARETGQYTKDAPAQQNQKPPTASKTVKLDEHVGHQVTVTGSAYRESKAQEKAGEKKEGQMEKAAGKEAYGDLRVTALKMVSETCSK